MIIMNEVKIKEKIREDLFKGPPKEKKNIYRGIPVYIDGKRFPSMFAASIHNDISNVQLWKSIKQHHGAPCIIKKHHVVLESWLTNNPEYLQ